MQGSVSKLDLRNSFLAHGLWMALFAAMAAPTLGFLWEKWTRNIWSNGHGLFVPFLVAFLAYYALQREPVKREEPTPWGFALLVPALFLIAIDSAIKTELLSAFGLLLCLPGFALLTLGPTRSRALLFPFFLSFFMLPIPAAFKGELHLLLQRLTTMGSESVLRAIGRPALAEGTLLYLPHGTFRVVEECSGFSALYAAVTIALVLAYLSSSRARRGLLLAVAFPLALLCNVTRIVTLAILAEEKGFYILDTHLHLLSGYVAFGLTLGLLFLFAEHGPPRSDA